MKMKAALSFIRKHEELIFNCFLVVVFIFFCTQLYYFYVPDTDVFEYIMEGRSVIHNPLLWTPTPPLYSVIVYLFEILLPVRYPGIVGGTILNIVCFVLTLYYLRKIAAPVLGRFAIFPVLCFLFNPLSFGVVLQPLNLPLSLLMVLMVLYYFEKRPVLSLAMTMLAFFSRYETGVLFLFPAVVFMLDKRRRAMLLFLVVFTIPCAFWVYRSLFVNNLYLTEIAARVSEIPNLPFFTNSFITAPFVWESSSVVTVVMIVLWLVAGACVYYRKNHLWVLLLGVFVLGYCAVHAIFPDSTIRYSYPLLPLVYILWYWPVVFISKKKSVVNAWIIAFLCFSTIFVFYRSFSWRKYPEESRGFRSEKRLIADWLKANVTKPTVVYTYMPHVVEYYAKTPSAKFVWDFSQPSFSKELCKADQDVIVVVDYDVQRKAYFYDYAMGLGFVRDFSKSAVFNDFSLVAALEKEGRWANVYKRITVPKELCAK